MPQMVRHKHMQTHAQAAWWETLNSKLKFTFIWENSRENNMLFFHQWYFWIKQPKSSPRLHPITMMLWFKLCGFFGTNCVFPIGWQWYYDWMDPCRQKIPGAKGQWGNLNTCMNAEHFQGHDQTQEHSVSTRQQATLCWIELFLSQSVFWGIQTNSSCATWHQCHSTCLDEV